MTKTSSFRVFTVLAAMTAAMLLAVLVLSSSYAPAQAQSAEDILKQPPFEPTDTSLLLPEAYSDAPPTAPDSSGPTDEATLRGLLSDLLEQRFSNSPKKVNKALAIFDSEETKAIVPDPRLRAALVSLKGTAGEAAIAGTLDGTYSSLQFGTPCCDAIAQVPPGEDPLRIVFNEKYQFEDFRLLASTLAHEPLHRDSINSEKEELINHAMHILVHGQFLLENPDLATSGTELARNNNTFLMARINTRDAEGKLRLFTSQGNIFPGNTSKVFVPYFAAFFEPLGDDTPGNRVLKGELKKVVLGKKVPKRPQFNDKTVLLLDKYQRVFTDTEVVQLAQILKLDTSPPSAAAEAQRAQEEAEASEQPVPDWREIFGEQ
jgi:hypothetical protein